MNTNRERREVSERDIRERERERERDTTTEPRDLNTNKEWN